MVATPYVRLDEHRETNIPADYDVEHMTINELEPYCRREINRFRRTGRGDERFVLEVFRRAVLSQEEAARNDAWALIFHLFAPLVLSWITQNSKSAILLRDEAGSTSLINAIFAKI